LAITGSPSLARPSFPLGEEAAARVCEGDGWWQYHQRAPTVIWLVDRGARRFL